MIAQSVGTQPTDLISCDVEPIHIPGRIQPYGVLLALDEPGLRVAIASANAALLLGDDPTGKLLDRILTPDSMARLETVLAAPDPRPAAPVPLTVGGRTFDGIAHRHNGRLILELEPTVPAPADFDPERLVRFTLANLSNGYHLKAFCDAVAREVRALTGYDRVMVYRFDPDWNGEVFAEDKRDDLEPFLGLHYPASDIPPQARRLYQLNLVRHIPDVTYTSSPLVPDRDPRTREVLDLSRSVLRSVSPIHVEYLQNMGVWATLTISLMKDGVLWGLVACHHYAPKFLPYRVRAGCESLAVLVSLQLTAKLDTEDLRQRLSAQATLARLTAGLGSAADVDRDLVDRGNDLIALAGADGAAVVFGGRGAVVGRTPGAEQAVRLARWLNDAGHDVFATHRLPAELSGTDAATACGLLAVRVVADDYLLWFRTEIVGTVDWAGDPRYKRVVTGPNGPRLTPRGSFVVWKEEHRGQSKPWGACERDMAFALRDAVRTDQARRAAGLRAEAELRRIEGQLWEKEELLREAAELAHVGGWSFDPATGQSEWTEETFRIHNLDPTGRAENVAQGVDRFPGDDGQRLAAAVRAATEHGTPYDLELDFIAADGQKKRVRSICRPITEKGKVIRVRGSLQDVTRRHELEEKLRQSQKMDAFGQLAGGVAHDFNNMLQVINGYAALLLRELQPEDPKAELITEIRQAGVRSATLTRQLLAFARQEVVVPRVLDISTAAGDTVGMLRRVIGEDIRLVTDLQTGVWPVLADPGQLEQILLNLAVNARDAMPDGGTLTVVTRNETVAASAEHPDAKPGPHAVLSVTDTVTGIPPDVLERIFEPFFTTKEVGKGTGLGLATVYGIVRQAGGHLRVRSKLKEGSTFEALLPRTGEATADEPNRPAARTPPRGRETVLVVEDEKAVRMLVRKVLSGHGYTILEAADGTAAERVAAEHNGTIHLVLSDVVMPGAGGRVAAAGVSAKHPEAKVLFMSGYTDDAIMRQGISTADVSFLQKPFTPDMLAAKVRQVLDAPR